EIDSERRRLSLSAKRVEGQVLPVRRIEPEAGSDASEVDVPGPDGSAEADTATADASTEVAEPQDGVELAEPADAVEHVGEGTETQEVAEAAEPKPDVAPDGDDGSAEQQSAAVESRG